MFCEPFSRGEEVYIELPLSTREMLLGTENTILHRGRMITVSVPAKLKEGTKLRLRGQGRFGGVLYLVVKRNSSWKWQVTLKMRESESKWKTTSMR